MNPTIFLTRLLATVAALVRAIDPATAPVSAVNTRAALDAMLGTLHDCREAWEGGIARMSQAFGEAPGAPVQLPTPALVPDPYAALAFVIERTREALNLLGADAVPPPGAVAAWRDVEDALARLVTSGPDWLAAARVWVDALVPPAALAVYLLADGEGEDEDAQDVEYEDENTDDERWAALLGTGVVPALPEAVLTTLAGVTVDDVMDLLDSQEAATRADPAEHTALYRAIDGPNATRQGTDPVIVALTPAVRLALVRLAGVPFGTPRRNDVARRLREALADETPTTPEADVRMA